VVAPLDLIHVNLLLEAAQPTAILFSRMQTAAVESAYPAGALVWRGAQGLTGGKRVRGRHRYRSRSGRRISSKQARVWYVADGREDAASRRRPEGGL